MRLRQDVGQPAGGPAAPALRGRGGGGGGGALVDGAADPVLHADAALAGGGGALALAAAALLLRARGRVCQGGQRGERREA